MMAGLRVNMPDELREFVDRRAGEKGFATPTEYIRQLVREDHERAVQERHEQLLVEGLESGDPITMAPDDWAEILKTARQRVAARRKESR
jgi:antitoxin ParD1/3/4